MIFTDEELKGIDVNDAYEYLYPDNIFPFANVMLDVDDLIRKKACDFLGISYDDVIINGWVDVSANIDVNEQVVTGIHWNIVPNDDDICEENVIEIKTYPYEGKKIYEQLTKTPGFTEFIEDAKECEI